MAQEIHRPLRPTLALLFGTTLAVDRRSYLVWGVALMVLKLAGDAALLFAVDGVAASVGLLMAPTVSLRLAADDQLSSGTHIALALWAAPFAWIGLTMSVRRAADAGLPPIYGLLFCLPFVNLALMLGLATRPTAGEIALLAETPGAPTFATSRTRAALEAVGLGVALGAPVVVLTAAVLGDYGTPLFVSSPFLIGALAGWRDARSGGEGARRSAAIGAAAIAICGALLLLFALEGVICLLMAVPVAVPAGAIGGVLGGALARPRRLGAAHLTLALPVFAMAASAPPTERVVHSFVDVEATPAQVWPVVVAFPDIPSGDDVALLFRAGVAMPLRARIDGVGVGAIRRCEFTTGAFVEPITAWQPPERLAFDVTEQPAPMRELSPWPEVFAPHLLDHTLRSHRGEFVLEALPGGRTRLHGRTWYSVAMGPEAYWGLWVDAVVHQVHLRVLRHIALRSIAAPAS